MTLFSFISKLKSGKTFLFLAKFKLLVGASPWLKLKLILPVTFMKRMVDIRKAEKLPDM